MLQSAIISQEVSTDWSLIVFYAQDMEKWFKFYSADYLLDGKIRSLSPQQRSCWITLLCLADTSEIPGEISHLSEYDLLEMAGVDKTRDEWGETEGILELFEKKEMLKRNDNDIKLQKTARDCINKL